jgi:alanine racemase
VLYDAGQVAELAAEVRYRGADPAAIHLKLDTGMGRLGAQPKDLVPLAELLRSSPELRLQGLMTHFASADTDPESIAEQLARFNGATAVLREHGVTPEWRHAASTAAVLSNEASHLDCVRPGIGIFGVEPAVGLAPELKPVMRVVSTVIALRELEPGQSVGYGATWRATRKSTIATIPMGYADGLARACSNRTNVLVRGKRAPVAGTVSMDLTTIDVTDVPGVAIGDEVTVLGTQKGPLGEDCISARELADALGTIPWEVLTNISRRVPRFYRGA